MFRHGFLPSLLALSTLLPLMAFVNCTPPRILNLASPASSGTSDNGGHPYDGKIYAEAGNCADGTLIRTRIIYRITANSKLVKENCQVIPTRDLGATEFSVDHVGDSINYQGQVLRPESSPQVLPNKVSFYIQTNGSSLNEAVNASTYVIDMYQFSNVAPSIANLKSQGRQVLCWISAGAISPGLPDESQFPPAVRGNTLPGGTGNWLDTNSSQVRSLMVARLDYAKSIGCDGVDLDNMDAYIESSGFPLNAVSQIDFNQFMAFAAHDRGLIAALHNNSELAETFSNSYDLSINENCFARGTCSSYASFVAKGKPALSAQTSPWTVQQCSDSQVLGMILAAFDPSYSGTYSACPE